MNTVGKACVYVLAIAGLRWIEFMIRPGAELGLARPLAAVLSVLHLLLAAGGLGVLFCAWWLVRRLRGGAAPPSSARRARPPAPLTAADRARSFGRDVSLGWMFGGVVVLIILTDTGAGPFAWAAAVLLGHDSAALALVLGCVAWLAPMLLLGVLPRQTRWQVLGGAQDIFKPPTARARKRRRRG